MFALAPDIDARRRRILSPGGLVGVGIWIVASVGFVFYVSNFGRYGATYGAFAGAVVLPLWLYISSVAFLFGAELNSVVDGAGHEVPTAARAAPDACGCGSNGCGPFIPGAPARRR